MNTPGTPSSEQLAFLCGMVRQRSGMLLDPGRRNLMEARLGPLIRREGIPSLADLVEQLRVGGVPHLEQRVVESFATLETMWFRDATPFEALRARIIPEILGRPGRERTLDLWCAACSTGQEPYSIAMLLREYFPALLDWRIRILATDISDEALGRASEGRYSQLEVNRGMPAPLLIRYFEKQGLDWVVRDEVRRMVTFRNLNLARPWTSLPTFDVVFMRNVLIYLDHETRRTVLDQMSRALSPAGVLFLGTAESPLGVEPGLERKMVGQAVCYVRRHMPAGAMGAGGD